MVESDEEELKMPASKSNGGAQDQSPTNSSSGYSSTPLDSSKPSSSATDSEKPPPAASSRKKRKANLSCHQRELKPAPYFYYVDHSQDVDDDPLAPLSPALSVPNFVIKLHAILIVESLSGVIEWMPHGRSFMILNQSEFEKQVLPIYFKQSSIASFYRQANGWGFRRMLKGPDKGSFYNERFIRGMPFLCKKLKRTGGAKLADTNINHEPMLPKISAEYPAPLELSKNTLDWISLNTINESIKEGGPNAKMPFVHNIDAMYAHTKNEASAGMASAPTTDNNPRNHDASILLGGGRGDTTRTASSLSSSLNHDSSGLSHPQVQALLQEQHIRMQQLQSQNEQTTGLLLHMLKDKDKNRDAAVATLSQQHQQQQHLTALSQANIANILRSAGHLSSPIPAAAAFASAPPRQEGNIGAQQQHQAQQQQQPRAAISQANIASILSSAGRFQSPPYPATSDIAGVPLQGNLGPLAQLLGLQLGNNSGIVQPSIDSRINTDILGQHLFQASLAQQGQQQVNPNSLASLSSMLQNLTQTQSQPAARTPNLFQDLQRYQTAPSQIQVSPTDSVSSMLAYLGMQRQQQDQLTHPQLQLQQHTQQGMQEQHQHHNQEPNQEEEGEQRKENNGSQP
ncbi:hypothetical protein ACHAXR_009380 [Thalassiosira sp. AJA248-18]